MLLLEPQKTEFDLRWKMFDVWVRVHPMFWAMAAILGWSQAQLGFQYVLVWIGCVFVSILIHELGHVLVGRLFGSHGYIVLYSFGGIAVGSTDGCTRWQRVAVIAAGPLAGFVFLGAIFGVLAATTPDRVGAYWSQLLSWLGVTKYDPFFAATLMDQGIEYLIFINLLWGLMNLLPVWPLDGGQISRELFGRFVPRRALRLSLGLSFVIAGLLALHSLMRHFDHPLLPFLRFGGPYTALLFGLLAVQSFMMLQQVNQATRRWGDDFGERDPTIWR